MAAVVPASTDPLFIPTRRTQQTPREVFEAICDAWPRVIGGEPSRESVLVLLSQWSIETGDGRSCWNFNLGNVKRVKGQPWTWLNSVWEILGGKKVVFQPPHPQTHFRAFHTAEDGAEAYLQFLHTRFARSWPAVMQGDPAAFAHALKLQGYYTAPEEAYVRAIRGRFDHFAKTIPAERESDPGTSEIMSRHDAETALIVLGYVTTDLDAAIRAFQEDHPFLKRDGIVGPMTSASIQAALNEHKA